MSDQPVLLCEVEGGVGRLTLNRPERRNSLNPTLINALSEGFLRLKSDPEARVILLTGSDEKAFCAGGDLSGDGLFNSDSGLMRHFERSGFADLFRVMKDLGKPIVARLNGHALGGGFGLALAADIVVAHEGVKLGAPEIKLGLFPMVIMATLVRNMPRKKLLEYMLTGERITAQEAYQWGMINHVVPQAELDGKVDQIIQAMLTKSPATLKLGRDSFYAMQDMGFEQALTYLNAQLTVNLQAEDVSEGVSAFFAKRQPQWKGR